MRARIEARVAPWVRGLVPYHVEDAAGLVKLDAMENPYPLPEALREGWNAVLRDTPLNRYPDPHATALRQRWSAALGLGPEVAVVLGNGSDELIHLLCMAFARGREAVVLCPEPGFAVYRIAAQALGLRYVGVPLRARDFGIDLDATLAAIDENDPALVFVASPNNPTGNRFDEQAVDAICARAGGLVVLDEAYYRFARRTRVADVLTFENLVVMHTLSKVGLAGLRVGALFGPAPWIEVVERVRMPYNINALSQAGALFALGHEREFERQINLIIGSREMLAAALDGIGGISAWPSETNFILFRVPAGRGGAVFAYLRTHGILVKNVAGAHPLLADCLRVTVGTPDENDRFVEVLRRALA